MKKLSKILMFSLLGLALGLSGCNKPHNPDNGTNGPTQELRTTYLVLGEGGLYNGQPGESFAHLSLDNSVEFEAEVGSDLPNASVVTNSNGKVLHYWYSVDGTGTETVTYKVPVADYTVLYAKYGNGTASIMRVYFRSPDSWKNANIYAWSNTEGEMAGWPGTPMAQETNGLWYFDYDTSTYDNVIFNNGSEQTADLKSPTSADADCYVWNNGWYNEDTDQLPGGNGGGSTGGTDTPNGENMRVYFKSPGWTKANIYIWNSAQQALKAWPGTEMNKDENGLFYFDYDVGAYPNVIFNNGSGTQTADLKSPTSDTADCYDWASSSWIDDQVALNGSTGGDSGNTTPDNPTTPTSGGLYFAPNGNWKADYAWFAAYFFGAGETWTKLEDTNADGIYETNIPTGGYTSVIFCRMNSANTTLLSWDNKWDQTVDLTIPSNGNNLFTISEGQWNNATGAWSTYNG